MKIAFLTSRFNRPSYRFRVAHYLPFLRAGGVICDPYLIPRDRLRRFGFYRALASYDIVLLQKKLPGKLELCLLRAWSRRLVYDCDDAVIYREHGGEARLSHRRRRRFRAVTAASDLVISGNAFLHSIASTTARKVICLPTVVDTEHYYPGERAHRDRCVIGWMGSRSTNPYLNPVMPVLKRLARKYPIELRMVSDTPEGINIPRDGGLATHFSTWRRETEVAELQRCDLGLMPLPDNEWTRGKCGLKALLYMACGVVPLCSPVGVACDMITDGMNGMLAGSFEEWEKKIAFLLEHPEKRERVARAARETVCARYSVSRQAPRFIAALREVCRRG